MPCVELFCIFYFWGTGVGCYRARRVAYLAGDALGERAGEREREDGAFLCSFLTRWRSRGGAEAVVFVGIEGGAEGPTSFSRPCSNEATASASASAGSSSALGAGGGGMAASAGGTSSASSAASGLTIILPGGGGSNEVNRAPSVRDRQAERATPKKTFPTHQSRTKRGGLVFFRPVVGSGEPRRVL